MNKDIKILFWLSVILMGFILCKYYWRLQIMYNSTVVSSYTPDTFSLYKPERYEERCRIGLVDALKKRVVITGMVRDIASKIPDLKRKVTKVASMFLDYHILIVENDSKDDTRQRLLEWASENPRVTILGCGYNAQECSMSFAKTKTDGHHVDRKRIEKMVHLRNIYLKEIKDRFIGWDYTIMWDMDSISSVYLDGIYNSLGYLAENFDVDLVCANGIYRWGLFTIFYDSYAFLHKGEPFHIDHKTVHDIRKLFWEVKHERGEEPIEVDSCFSGFAIYRTSSLIPENVYYDMSGEDNLECEHVRLNMKIQGKKVMNPSMINLILENT